MSPRPRTLTLFLLCAALCSGFGGLCFEIVCLRRAALALGSGSWSVAAVVAGFLAGLGLGGRWLGAHPALVRRGLQAPFLLYLLLVLLLPLGYGALSVLRLPWVPLESLAWSVLVAALALPMGGAFPHLFPALTAGLGPTGAHVLQGCNLLGSALGASLGAVVLVPRMGLALTTLIAASSYFVAAVLVWAAVPLAGPDTAAAAAGSRPLGRRVATRLMAGGFATLGLQLWMPRRLVFFVGGFLPSLSGTLVAVLVGLAAGAFLAGFPRLRSALRFERLPALCAGGLGLAWLLVETLGPGLAASAPHSDLAAMLRSSLGPALLVLPATLPLGALLPAALVGPGHRGQVPAGDAGRAFLWFSCGAGLAALLLPPLFDLGLSAVLCASAVPVLLCGRRPSGMVPAAAALSLPFLLGLAGRPLLETARHTELGAARRIVVAESSDPVCCASVVLDRIRDELRLYTDEFTAAGGARSSYMLALGFLPLQLGVPVGDLCLICLGTGTTAAALARVGGERPLHVVELSPAVVRLSDRFAGYPTWARHPGLQLWIEDGRRYLEQRPAGGLAVLTLEPLLPQAPGSVHLYSREFYEAAWRALAPGGRCLQWLPTHALPPAWYRSLIATMASVFPELELFVLDDSTLLCGRRSGPENEATAEVLAAAASDAWLCGLCSRLDRDLARVPLSSAALAAIPEPVLVDDRPFVEAEVFAPAAERASWLGRNLSWLVQAGRFEDALGPVRKARLEARIGVAEAQWDPTSGGAEEALGKREGALRAAPASELLHREWDELRALVLERRATRALAQGLANRALQDARAALALGGAPIKLLAVEAAAAESLGDRPGALAAHGLLLALAPDYRSLPEIEARRGAGLEPLWAEPYRSQAPTVADDPEVQYLETGRCLPFLQAPRRFRGRLLEALASERLVPAPDAFARFARTLGPGGLARLRDFGLMHPEHARALMAALPSTGRLPDWLAALSRGGPEDRMAFLQGVEQRDDALAELFDLCEVEADPRLTRYALAVLARRLPEAARIDPTLDLDLRARKIRELRRKHSQTER